MSDYENSVACKMLDVHCIFCGRPLVDAESVERGYGPECAKQMIFWDVLATGCRNEANKLVYRAAMAAQHGEISVVEKIAEELHNLGFVTLAEKVGKRFRNAARYTEIVISIEGDKYRVETPFRRGAKEEFIAAWRKIPGRRFIKEANYIPVSQKKALWELLGQFFAGKYGKGPKGTFRIPMPEPYPRQDELQLQKVG